MYYEFVHTPTGDIILIEAGNLEHATKALRNPSIDYSLSITLRHPRHTFVKANKTHSYVDCECEQSHKEVV